MDERQLVRIAADVARAVWGEPNKQQSTPHELRWGRGGSKSLDVKKGTWFDHEQGKGGGVLDLVEAAHGLKGRDAVAWLHENGFDIDYQPGRAPAKAARRDEPERDPRDGDRGEWRKDKNGELLPPGVPDDATLTKTFDYVDEGGKLLFQVCRFEYEEAGRTAKTFRQRHRDGSRWRWSTKGLRQVPYNIAELQSAVADGLVVFVVEGEKCVEILRDMGLPATTNAMGAGKWPEELNGFFRGADVVIIPDNDPQSKYPDGRLKFHPDGRPMHTGRDHAEMVASNLVTHAKRVRVLELPGLAEKEDVYDWIGKGNEASDLYRLADEIGREWSPVANFRSKFGGIPWSKLEEPRPQHEWLIKNVLTRHERSMVVGESQSGKTFFVIDLALSVARGVDFFGNKVKQGGVVYQAGEGALGVHKRLKAYRMFHGVTVADPVPLFFMTKPIDLFGGDDQTIDFINECNAYSAAINVPLELIVIDTFSAATPGANENSSEDVGPVLARCARIAEATGAHVMFVHHLNAAGSKARGHSSIFANLDSAILVRKCEGHHDVDGYQVREAIMSKLKDGESGKRIRFTLRQVVLGKDADGDEITSCAVTPPNEGRMAGVDMREDKGLRLSSQCATFLRAIYKAIEEYGHNPLPNMSLPQSVKVVNFDRIRTEFTKMTFEGDGAVDDKAKANAIRQAMKRHGEFLISNNIIGRASPYVWLTGKPVKGFRRLEVVSNVVPFSKSETAPNDPTQTELGFDDDLPI